MDKATVEETIHTLRTFGAEVSHVEAKLAVGGLPKSVASSVAAFANTAGGTIILGLDEREGFRTVGVPDPGKLAADLATECREALRPPLLPEIDIHEVEGARLVVAVIDELPKSLKPAYLVNAGINRGSYVRVSAGDHRLTTEEVQAVIADRGQPTFDAEPVPNASLEDLDPRAVKDFIERLKERNKRIFADEPDETILRMAGVLEPGGGGRPTLAGLLALGRYPQQFFPQLDITFVHYPTDQGPSSSAGLRFLDNVTIDGSIPVMLTDAMAVIQRNMSRRAMVMGAGRSDLWEYPLEALREAIVNALAHRDLSPGSRGNQVQVEMYPDRLRIVNAGGLFGTVDIEQLGEEGRSSSRNAVLMKILEDVVLPETDRRICENRGSGIRAIVTALRQAGMSPPLFLDKVTSFEVIFPNHTLFDDGTIEWLRHLGREELRDTQCTALALLRRGEVLDNLRYRAATGITDSRVATFELQDLVARELVVQSGTRGGARYTLSTFAEEAGRGGLRRPRPNRRLQILEFLELETEASKSEIAAGLALNVKTVEHWLRQMKSEGAVEATAPGRGNRYTRYRLTARALQGVLFGQES